MSWLSRHSAGLTTLASLIQSLAVLVGIWFAVWEFVLSGNQQKMHRVQNTLQFVERRYDNSLTDATDVLYFIMTDRYKSDKELDAKDLLSLTRNVAKVEDLDRFYGMLTTCVTTGTCDDASVESFFCEDALTLSDVVKSLNEGMPEVAQIRMSSLANFANEICTNGRAPASENVETTTEIPWEEWADIMKGREAEEHE